MKKETLKKIFYFLENEENKKIPTDWKSANDKIIKQKLINGEPLTDYDLTIENYLDLQDTEITSLPIGFTVKNNLELGFSKITSLPKGLYVGGKLSLIRCKNLKFLPKGLYVGDSLNLMDTNIDSLPEGLYVGDGGLSIWGTPLAKKYTDQEIIDNVASTGGEINGRIYR